MKKQQNNHVMKKKSRKAMAKLGMKQVTGIMRVTVKKSRSILFVIQKPDVFKSPNSETYIIFGEAKVEDLSAQQQAQAANKFKGPTPTEAPVENTVEETEEDDNDVDETGIDEKDIELVMQQGNVGRPQAVKALKKHEGDIVNAILELQ